MVEWLRAQTLEQKSLIAVGLNLWGRTSYNIKFCWRKVFPREFRSLPHLFNDRLDVTDIFLKDRKLHINCFRVAVNVMPACLGVGGWGQRCLIGRSNWLLEVNSVITQRVIVYLERVPVGQLIKRWPADLAVRVRIRLEAKFFPRLNDGTILRGQCQ